MPGEESAPTSDSTFVSRVVLSNYRSISSCDVELGPLTFLVGPNGSGKSNFLDALRFVADSLWFSLDHAIRNRGGVAEIRRRSGGHPNHFGIRLDLRLAGGLQAAYAFRIGGRSIIDYAVQHEACTISHPQQGPLASFTVRDGKMQLRVGAAPIITETLPPASSSRLSLVHISGHSYYRPVSDGLSRMGVYNLNVARMREPQPSVPGDMLAGDGSNIATVLRGLSREAPQIKGRMEEYLAAIVPGVQDVAVRSAGAREFLEFRQSFSAGPALRLPASSMSDGTLRSLGILVALFQGQRGEKSLVPLVGIEEPETALHPAAVGVLLDVLREASLSTQVIVASHSADLLDDKEIETEQIRAVIADDGETQIGPLDQGGRATLRDHLYTAGELLRMDQLRPEPRSANGTDHRRTDLFAGMPRR